MYIRFEGLAMVLSKYAFQWLKTKAFRVRSVMQTDLQDPVQQVSVAESVLIPFNPKVAHLYSKCAVGAVQVSCIPL